MSSDILRRIKRAVLAGNYAFSEKALLEMEQESLVKPMTLQLTHCPTCGSEQIKQVCRDWTGAYRGQTYVVPALTFYECPVCGERVFEREALARIQAVSPAFARRPPKAHPTTTARTSAAPHAGPAT
jgi:YgiT-type zinc finger domain-containing protein